jgi:hypothetical protein
VTDGPEDERPGRTGHEADASTEDAEARRRRRARVFGDVLPDTTEDDRDGEDESAGEEWLRRNVPPHHG